MSYDKDQNNTPLLVEVKNLKKHFWVDRPLLKQLSNPFGPKEKVCALEGITFSTEAGQILGVVGPNGAGKTTLLRLLADLLTPDKGTIKICGETIGSNN